MQPSIRMNFSAGDVSERSAREVFSQPARVDPVKVSPLIVLNEVGSHEWAQKKTKPDQRIQKLHQVSCVHQKGTGRTIVPRKKLAAPQQVQRRAPVHISNIRDQASERAYRELVIGAANI